MSDIAAGSSWNRATAVAAPEHGRLNLDIDVDVCVIGGGLAGLTVARELARGGWSVAVLEANRVGHGASGLNTGFVIPGFGESFDGIVERTGLPWARALWAHSEHGVDYVRDTIRETAMPGVEIADGWLNVSKTGDDESFVAYAELLQSNGIAAEAWSAGRVRGVLRSKSYFNAIYYPRAFHIHPLNYALGLAAAAGAAGARIYENTQALSIDPAGVRKRVVTPDGRVRAAHVVLAGNTQLNGVVPRVAATLLPITTYVVTTAPQGERLEEVMSYRGAVSDTQRADNHYRVVDGDRLMWSGGMTTWPGNPRHYIKRLRADMLRAFPQLGDIAIDYAWSGTLGRTVHRMPQIGEISRGLWIASGFSGHGLNTTAMAGQLVARGILNGDQDWRAFSPYGLIWAGGALGRAFGQSVYWFNRPRNLARERLARRRERQGLHRVELARLQAREEVEEQERRRATAAEQQQADNMAQRLTAAADKTQPDEGVAGLVAISEPILSETALSEPMLSETALNEPMLSETAPSEPMLSEVMPNEPMPNASTPTKTARAAAAPIVEPVPTPAEQALDAAERLKTAASGGEPPDNAGKRLRRRNRGSRRRDTTDARADQDGDIATKP